MSSLIRQTVIDKTSVPLLKRMLDLSAFRNKLIASNVANATTPGYKARSIDFNSELKKAMVPPRLKIEQTDPRHMPLKGASNSAPDVELAEPTVESNGINSVNIDSEMANLAQNSLTFELGAKLAGSKFKALKGAIRGRAL
jgi:flagellar basal-body rod protein FlgB